jgi:signal transduction histidine kinase
LTPLISLLPVIKESVTDPKSAELLDTCIRSAEYIKRVINNTRELAELSTTDLYLTRQSLSNILNEMLDKYESIFKSCNIKIDNFVDDDIFVMTEKSRLSQVFDHVTSNAVNAMIEEGGILTFKANKVEQKTGVFLNVSIIDTGKSLNRDQAEHLFDEFYKVDESRHKLDSTGLGLSICRKIIEKHGGHIWAKSMGPRKGVTINFTIPYVE